MFYYFIASLFIYWVSIPKCSYFTNNNLKKKFFNFFWEKYFYFH